MSPSQALSASTRTRVCTRPTERMRFVVNPRSHGGGDVLSLRRAFDAFAVTHHLDADWRETQCAGHATLLAREAMAAGCGMVVAVGGDGTINEIAQALVHSDVVLGIIPSGSGNGLARHLGLPLRPVDALRCLVPDAGRPTSIDTGRVNGHLFWNTMGLGLDAEVGASFNRQKNRGLLGYFRVGIRAFHQRKSERVCVSTSNGRTYDAPCLLVAIANSDQYGNDLRIAPGACVHDGSLDLVHVAPLGWCRAICIALGLAAGWTRTHPSLTRLRASAFKLEREQLGLIHTDGEIFHEGRILDVDTLPASLRVQVPIPA